MSYAPSAVLNRVTLRGIHYAGARVVNNQFSGARKVKLDLICFLFRSSSCLYKFNSYLDRLVRCPEVKA